MSAKITSQQSLPKQSNKNQGNQAKWAIYDQYPDLYWDTIYIDGKYYVAHPLELDKLMKLQVEIKNEKIKLNMNENQQNSQKNQNQEITQKSQLDNYRPLSGLSRQCKTQINEVKQLKAKIKAQTQLIGQQEKYQMRLAQINKKKKELQQTDVIPSNLKNSRKDSAKSQKSKPIVEQKGTKQKQQSFQNKIKQSSIKGQQKINQSKLKQSSKKGEDKKSQLSKSKASKSQIKQNQSHPQKNYISFHPNEAMGSPKFQMNQTKTGKFIQNQAEKQIQLASLRQSANNNTSRMGNKSFVVNLRKTPSNSKQPRQSFSNSRRDIKSASSTTSKLQLQVLNKKLKEMQQKLAQVQSKQRQLQQIQKSRLIAPPQKQNLKQSRSVKKESRQSDQTQKVEGQQYKVLFASKKRYNEQIIQNQEQKNHKMQQSGKVEYQILNSNKSSAMSNQPQQKNSKQSHVFDLTIYRTKKLHLASNQVQYNYSEDLSKMKKQIQEINEKQKMASEISDLKKMIRQLKLERIKQQTMIQQLQKKQKQQASLNNLLISKLDQGSPKLRIPTQKKQKLQTQEDKKVEQKVQFKSSKQKIKKNQFSSLQTSQLKKVDSNQSPIIKKQNTKSLKIQTGTQTNFKRTQNLPSIQKTSKINLSSKQMANIATNPEQSNYREFHPYPLKRKGIVVRQVLQNQKQVQGQKSMSNNKSSRENDDQPFSPLSTGRKIFQLQFVKQTKKKTQIVQQQPDLTVPNITVKAFAIPQLPQTPTIDISQLDLLRLAKYICDVFHIKVQSDDHIYMKKYKNCIIFKTPDVKKTVVWHYSGKFYIGGWDQNQQGEGKKNGQGFQYVPQKYYYQGQFLDGKKNGSGIMIYINGNIYKGQWVKGLKHGLGTYFEQQTGLTYQGQWKQDKKDGKGILKISDNQFYDGTFIKSIKHGYGLQLFNNGDYYKGQYKMGRFHGKGRYVWKNGASYDGNFVQGRRQGIGRWKSNKTQYDLYFGQYKSDKKSGKGQYTWNNGTVYQGQFVNDLKHGQGKVQYPDGRQIRGYWQSGKLIEVDQNIQQSQTSSQKNQPLSKPQLIKHLQINSKQLQPSRKLTKF